MGQLRGRIAYIDVGTMTARLCVAERADNRVLVVEKRSEICALGEGLAQTGRLAEAAIERVLEALRSYKGRAYELGAEAVALTLTEAARAATNASVLLEKIEKLGLPHQVIAGEVEAKLSFLGMAQDFVGEKICVADSGGGSTELVCGELLGGKLELSSIESIKLGCKTLTEAFLQSSEVYLAPREAAVEEARFFSLNAFKMSGAYQQKDNLGPLVVCGGTATTLAALDLGLERYDSARVHLHRLERERLQALSERLCALDFEGLCELKSLQKKRASVIAAGSIVLAALAEALQASELIVSESDLLIGASYALLCADQLENAVDLQLETASL